MPPAIQERETVAHADLVVTDVRPSRMGFWEWVGIMGIGSVLALLIVPKIMDSNASSQEFLQEQVKSQNEQSKQTAVAMTQAADAMDDLAGAISESVDADREFRQDLAPLIRQLDRVADAVEATQEATAEAKQ